MAVSRKTAYFSVYLLQERVKSRETWNYDTIDSGFGAGLTPSKSTDEISHEDEFNASK